MKINLKNILYLFFLGSFFSPLLANDGLPQFDVSKYSQQIFWFIILFSILFVVMKYVTVPKIEHIQKIRKNKVIIKIEKAEKIKKKISVLEREIADLKKVVDDKHIKLKQDLNKKISLLQESKRKDFEQFVEKSKEELSNKIALLNQDIDKNKDAYVKDLHKLILNKLDL